MVMVVSLFVVSRITHPKWHIGLPTTASLLCGYYILATTEPVVIQPIFMKAQPKTTLVTGIYAEEAFAVKHIPDHVLPMS